MARTRNNNTKKIDSAIIISDTKATIRLVNILNNITEKDIFNQIAAKTTMDIAEERFRYLLNGGNPEYHVEADFDGYKETLEGRVGGGVPIRVEVYDDNNDTLVLSADYADIKIAYINHTEMYIGDIIDFKGRAGFCYRVDNYRVIVLGRKNEIAKK